ncbi:MAG: hypothetical protein ACI8S3_002375, partial [Alphaproteobacteria bacterium]
RLRRLLSMSPWGGLLFENNLILRRAEGPSRKVME